MSTVTTDEAGIGLEHDDHSGCSFPFFRVTATPCSPATDAACSRLALPSAEARGDPASAARVTDTASAPTARGTAE